MADLTELLQCARQGCADSLGRLMELYRNYLRLIAAMQLNGQFREKFSASDIVQATFLQAHQRFADFRGNSEGELIAWLRKILVSQMMMEIRRYSTLARNVNVERQLHQQIDQSSILLAGIVAAKGETPSQTAMKRERAVILADALAQLPENYREVIILRHLRGYRFHDVAKEMDQTIDSVKSIWQRAIRRLRELLGDGPL
jgi:RNA polymerase sigma-70 factor (ECF subfamily)